MDMLNGESRGTRIYLTVHRQRVSIIFVDSQTFREMGSGGRGVKSYLDPIENMYETTPLKL